MGERSGTWTVGVAMLGVLVPLLVTMRGDVRELRRDKRLVGVETLLHERTGRPLVNPDPDPA